MSVKNKDAVPATSLTKESRRLIGSNRFPFAFLSALAERESWRKEIFRPVYHIHKWWAKRLGGVFRGIILGSLLPASEELEETFYRAHQFNASVFDPFMGSGTTVGEAAKLGCRAIGRDINPVSLIMVDTALQSYSERDVKYTFQKLEKTAGEPIRSFYCRSLDTGETVDVLYYFGVKVVPCPSCGQEQELFKTRIFSKHAHSGKFPLAQSLCPGCKAVNKANCHEERAHCQKCHSIYNPQMGNITRAGVRCSSCGALFNLIDAVRALEGPPGHKMYAKLVLHQNGRKSYLLSMR